MVIPHVSINISYPIHQLVLVYLMMLSQMEGLYSIEWLDASDELRMIWKEAAMNYFKKPYHNFPGETEENHKNNHQESQLPRLESNLETPEYEARVLTLNHIRNREYFRQRWK
jgi:hypothetical protein